MRNKFYIFLLKVIEFGITILVLSFLINGCSTTDKMTKKELTDFREDLRLRRNSLELERSYLKNILADSLAIDSLRVELKKCKEEIENIINSDSSKTTRNDS